MYSLLIKRLNFWGLIDAEQSKQTHHLLIAVFCAFSLLVPISSCSPKAEKQHHGAGVWSSREGRALQPRKSPQSEVAERGAATLRLRCAKEGSASRPTIKSKLDFLCVRLYHRHILIHRLQHLFPPLTLHGTEMLVWQKPTGLCIRGLKKV